MSSTVYRQGDKVMQIKNNYGIDVMNGDTGRVTAVNADDRAMEVRFGNRAVEVNGEKLNQIQHAYAMTVHKAQGGQTPAGVFVMSRSHAFSL